MQLAKPGETSSPSPKPSHQSECDNGLMSVNPCSLWYYLPMFMMMNQGIASLSPKTPAQTQLAGTIGVNASIIEQTRLLMSLQLASPVSWPLLNIVVSWAMLLFCGFGVLSRLNATSVIALGFGALAVASAVFLILELNEPFTGLFRIPGASVEQTIRAVGGEAASISRSAA
jgi:hypothetical protein